MVAPPTLCLAALLFLWASPSPSSAAKPSKTERRLIACDGGRCRQKYCVTQHSGPRTGAHVVGYVSDGAVEFQRRSTQQTGARDPLTRGSRLTRKKKGKILRRKRAKVTSIDLGHHPERLAVHCDCRSIDLGQMVRIVRNPLRFELSSTPTLRSQRWQCNVFIDALHIFSRDDDDDDGGGGEEEDDDVEKEGEGEWEEEEEERVTSARSVVADQYSGLGPAEGAIRSRRSPPPRRRHQRRRRRRIRQRPLREVFVFPYGCVVFWSWEGEAEELAFLDSLRECSSEKCNPMAKLASSDDMSYFVGKRFAIKSDEVELTGSPADPSYQEAERLAVSFAFAQSCLLSIYEWRLDQTILRNESIPGELALRGTIGMSQKAIGREVGRLFIERNSINLESDVLDTPEFFWEDDECEEVYLSACRYLDCADRTKILNKRLDCVKELLDVLIVQAEAQHASKLEWIIIWLIVAEVVLQGLDIALSHFF